MVRGTAAVGERAFGSGPLGEPQLRGVALDQDGVYVIRVLAPFADRGEYLLDVELE